MFTISSMWGEWVLPNLSRDDTLLNCPCTGAMYYSYFGNDSTQDKKK